MKYIIIVITLIVLFTNCSNIANEAFISRSAFFGSWCWHDHIDSLYSEKLSFNDSLLIYEYTTPPPGVVPMQKKNAYGWCAYHWSIKEDSIYLDVGLGGGLDTLISINYLFKNYDTLYLKTRGKLCFFSDSLDKWIAYIKCN